MNSGSQVTDTNVSGSATAGTGTLLSSNVTRGHVIGHSSDGVGVAIDKDVTLTDVVVTGMSVSQSGVQVNSKISNIGDSTINGSSEIGAGVSLNGTISGGELRGHSVSGSGLYITGDSYVNGVNVQSASDQGAAVQMDGKLSTLGSSLNGQGLPDTEVVDDVRQAAYQQHGVIANTEHMNHPTVEFGYRGTENPVSVEICTDSECSRLDVGTLVTPARH
ncbi:hypothetical protein J9N36_004693 [Salmonella enterica]|nr:hypothetical protein [Salmonella enterica]